MAAGSCTDFQQRPQVSISDVERLPPLLQVLFKLPVFDSHADPASPVALIVDSTAIQFSNPSHITEPGNRKYEDRWVRFRRIPIPAYRIRELRFAPDRRDHDASPACSTGCPYSIHRLGRPDSPGL